jgi:uncharacterized protein (TIGR03437 family)
MRAILKYFAILPVSCALCYGAREKLPVYFIAGDTAASGCQVLNTPGAPHITSNSLEFPDGQRIDFLNARSGVACTAEEAENRLSVFTGHDPSKWRAHLPLALRVRFRSVYPGVDLVYYGNGPQLEYDFEVAPGADTSRIRLGFGKRAGLKLSPGGDLLVTANGSTLIHHRPRVYQGAHEIAATYAIDKSGTQARIGLGNYDRSQPLIIDPVLGWQASFDRGAGSVNTVAADPGGNMWILSDFPGSGTGFTSTFGHGGGSRDAMLFKVDPTGSTLLYAVLLGGAGQEFANGVAIGNDGSAYIAGSTNSPDFPVTSQAFQTSLPSTSGGAAFVTKLSPQGDSLVYSTFLGGSGGASATAIAVDGDGNAFVAGTPVSTDFPLTTGSWEDHFSFYPLDTPYAMRPVAGGFVAKLNTTGDALLYSTLVDETPEALTLNSAGAAYVLGPALPYLGPVNQYTLKVGDAPSMIVTRLTPDGAKADMTVALSCLGPLYSHAGLIALDSRNNILVADSSTCATFPAGTAGAFQSQHTPIRPASFNFPPQYDGLIVKIAADASAVMAATFLGGSNVDQIQAIRVASDDSVMVAGGTSSNDFPVTPDALNAKYGGGDIASAGLLGDGFLARLSPNLDRLIYSTWLGGNGADNITSLALDLVDNAYLGGSTFGVVQSPGVFTFNGAGTLWALKLARDAVALPAIKSVTPDALQAGTGDSAIQIAGSSFGQNAVVLVNGAPAPTTFTSSSQLTATVSGATLAVTGLLELRVLNPGSAASDSFLLPVVAPAGANPNPRIESLLPDGLPAGSPGANISVKGSGFLASTTASINGKPRATSLSADNKLTVTLTQSDLSTAGTLTLTLTNPAPGGGVSAPASFLVSPALVPRQPPGLSSVAPSRLDKSADTPITVGVSGLSASAVARWNGTAHPIDLAHSTFTASAAELSHAGTGEVTIFDPATGLESNPLPVWVPYAATCTDMAWNAANRRLYLSTANSVIVLNPDTGDAEATIPVDIPIDRMTVSPDGGYLFATSSSSPTLRRYQILAAAPWLANPLDLSLSGIIDFAPVPGSPGSVAVYANNGVPREIAIYDGSVKRPATVQMSPSFGAASRALQFSDDGRTLYYVFGYSGVSFLSAPVTSSGLGTAVTKASANSQDSGASTPARYSQGRIYTSSGAVFDVTTMARVGAVPVSSYMPPLVSPTALIMLSTGSQYTCSLQAYDPVTLLPLWEENTRPGCDVNYYPYSDLFDVGGGRIAFRMTKAYLVRRPTQAPQFSVYPANSGLQATLELGTQYAPDNELGVLSRQNGLPAVAILLPDQPDVLALGPVYERNRYWPFSAPGYFDLEPPNTPSPGDTYTGRVALLISNTANPPVLAPYQLSYVNPYPLQASVSSLSFTWRIGDPAPATQSFALTKQGKPIVSTFAGSSVPSWLTRTNSDNGPPETITIGVKPAGLPPGTYTADVKMAYYGTTAGSVTVPVTLTVVGSGPPSISSLQDAESANTTVVPGEWVAIYGANLAGTSRIWGSSDFGSGGALPTQLDGVSVQFGGTPAAVYYVSPAQIDVQVPSGLSGSVPVVVSFRGASTAPFSVNVGTHAPSLFVYAAGPNMYPAATHADGSVIGDPAILAGARKAKPGESITLYVNGLAPSPGGTLIGAPVPYTDPVAVTLGGKNGSVSFAGLVAPGLFQVNVQVPPDMTTGDYPVTVAAGGQVSPGRVILPIQ